MTLDGLLDLFLGIDLGQNISLVDKSKSVFYLSQLLRTSVADDLFDCFKGLAKILLFAQALGLQDLGLNSSIRLIAIPDDLIVVPPLDILSLVESVDGVIIVVLGHEGLGKGDMHVDLK